MASAQFTDETYLNEESVINVTDDNIATPISDVSSRNQTYDNLDWPALGNNTYVPPPPLLHHRALAGNTLSTSTAMPPSYYGWGDTTSTYPTPSHLDHFGPLPLRGPTDTSMFPGELYPRLNHGPIDTESSSQLPVSQSFAPSGTDRLSMLSCAANYVSSSHLSYSKPPAPYNIFKQTAGNQNDLFKSNMDDVSGLPYDSSILNTYQHPYGRLPPAAGNPYGPPLTMSDIMPTSTLSPFMTPRANRKRSILQSNDEEEQSSLQCEICCKRYCRKSTLRAHMKQHSGEKPFMCHFCGKCFSQTANLTAHKRVHTGEKPFECSVCRRPFSQSSSLATHKRTHTGEKPYNCSYCGKRFADSSTLVKHVRTHTGDKPYTCPVCSQCFTQSGNLHRHIKTHRQLIID